jgi:hypothetical protein
MRVRQLSLDLDAAPEPLDDPDVCDDLAADLSRAAETVGEAVPAAVPNEPGGPGREAADG